MLSHISFYPRPTEDTHLRMVRNHFDNVIICTYEQHFTLRYDAEGPNVSPAKHCTSRNKGAYVAEFEIPFFPSASDREAILKLFF